MPTLRSSCPAPGCPALTSGGRCPRCRRNTERARGTRQQRGYTAAHDQLRAHWRTVIDTAGGSCHAPTCRLPTRTINPGDPFDLGHTADRTTWTGPEHPTCNRSH